MLLDMISQELDQYKYKLEVMAFVSNVSDIRTERIIKKLRSQKKTTIKDTLYISKYILQFMLTVIDFDIQMTQNYISNIQDNTHGTFTHIHRITYNNERFKLLVLYDSTYTVKPPNLGQAMKSELL